MAEISKQVGNRIKWARFVLASIRIHGGEVTDILKERYDKVPGFDGRHVGETMEALGVRLGEVTDRMEGAETAVAAELADDPPKRRARDERVDETREVAFDGRSAVERAFGEEAAAAYGLAETPPNQPDALLAYTANAVKLLRETPRSDTDTFGNTVSTDDIADELEKRHRALEKAVEAVTTEKREAHSARAERDEIVDEWTEVYRGTADALSGLYLLAGRADLADRVRPTVRRTAGKAEPPEDPEEELDDVDDPVEDDERTDEPVDDDEPVEV